MRNAGPRSATSVAQVELRETTGTKCAEARRILLRGSGSCRLTGSGGCAPFAPDSTCGCSMIMRCQPVHAAGHRAAVSVFAYAATDDSTRSAQPRRRRHRGAQSAHARRSRDLCLRVSCDQYRHTGFHLAPGWQQRRLGNMGCRRRRQLGRIPVRAQLASRRENRRRTAMDGSEFAVDRWDLDQWCLETRR